MNMAQHIPSTDLLLVSVSGGFGLLFAFVVLVVSPALLFAVQSVDVDPYYSGSFDDETLETILADSRDGDPPLSGVPVYRLPRLVNCGNTTPASEWLPLKASAWLLPNSADPSPENYLLAARPQTADPRDYTVLPLPLIDGNVAAVRLTAREVVIKGLILEVLREDRHKAVCLAIGLENIETYYYEKGWRHPPVLPYNWGRTRQILFRASGPRCRLRYYLWRLQNSVSCFSGGTDDNPGVRRKGRYKRGRRNVSRDVEKKEGGALLQAKEEDTYPEDVCHGEPCSLRITTKWSSKRCSS